jgi:hypothetical protein
LIAVTLQVQALAKVRGIMKNLIAVPAFYWFRRLPSGLFNGNFEVGLTGWLIIGDVSIVDSSFGRRPSARSFK